MSLVEKGNQYYSGFSPLQIPGCAVWLDAAEPSTITISGTNSVEQWRDKSGNARHANPAITARATYVTNTSVVFTGQTGTMEYYNFANTAALLQTTFFAIFMVETLNTTGSSYMIGDTVGNTRCHIGYRTPTSLGFVIGRPGDTSVSTEISGIPASPARRVWSFVLTGSTSNRYINRNGNRAGTNADTSQNDVFYNLQLGTVHSKTGNSYRGSMHEVLVYVGSLTTAQIERVEGYLAWKWSVASDVPATHSFKLIRPISRPFIPLDIDGCSLWLDAADTSTFTLSGSVVTQWRDKSGNANAITLVGSPTYVTGTYPYLATRNLTQYLSIPSTAYTTTSAQPGCLIFVYADTQTQGTNNSMLFGTSTPFDYFNQSLGRSDSQPYWISSTNTPASITSVLNTKNTMIYCLQYTHGSATILMRLYGSSMTLTTLAGSAAPTGAMLVSATGWGPAGTQANLNLNEILAFKASLTLTQVQQIEGYLAWKWGIPGNLPTAHTSKLYPSLGLLFTPSQVSNCALWLDAADTSTLTLSGSSVTQWRDKSGNARHATNVGTGVISGGTSINKLNTLNFATGSYLLTPSFTMNTLTRTAFVVCKFTSTAYAASGYVEQFFFLGNTATTGAFYLYSYRMNVSPWTWGFGFGISGVGTLPGGSTPYYSGSSGPNNQILMFGVQRSAGTSGIVSYTGSNVTPSFTTSGGFTATEALRVGAGMGNTQIAEIIYYNTALSLSQFQQVEGYLAWKWGLTASIPTTHPYKSVSP